jgi:hypothetical protein
VEAEAESAMVGVALETVVEVVELALDTEL